jgi:hypothetical protein
MAQRNCGMITTLPMMTMTMTVTVTVTMTFVPLTISGTKPSGAAYFMF